MLISSGASIDLEKACLTQIGGVCGCMVEEKQVTCSQRHSSLGVLEKIVSTGSGTAHRPARHLAVIRGKFLFLGAMSTTHLQIQAPSVGYAASNSWDAQNLENSTRYLQAQSRTAAPGTA